MPNVNFERAANYWNDVPKPAPSETIMKFVNKTLGTIRTCILSTASSRGIDATPVHYIWKNGSVYVFSEGGEKFKHLQENRNVTVAVCNQDGDFGNLHSVVIHGDAEIFTVEDEEFAEAIKWSPYLLNIEAMKKREAEGKPMHLIKIVPRDFKVLDSDFANKKNPEKDYSTYQFVNRTE